MVTTVAGMIVIQIMVNTEVTAVSGSCRDATTIEAAGDGTAMKESMVTPEVS